jgi:hypothetical protein
MYWINLILFFGYTSFWFHFLDTPLEFFINNAIVSYRTLPSSDFAAAMRFAFAFFLLNVFIRIRKSYKSLKNYGTPFGGGAFGATDDKTTNDISLTKTEQDRYKINFTIDNKRGAIFIQRSTEYDNIEGIYTEDYNDCVTSEVKPFFTFKQDMVRPRDIISKNKKNTFLIVTYKDKEERTIITDERIETDYMKDTEQYTDKTEPQMSEL